MCSALPIFGNLVFICLNKSGAHQCYKTMWNLEQQESSSLYPLKEILQRQLQTKKETIMSLHRSNTNHVEHVTQTYITFTSWNHIEVNCQQVQQHKETTHKRVAKAQHWDQSITQWHKRKRYPVPFWLRPQNLRILCWQPFHWLSWL